MDFFVKFHPKILILPVSGLIRVRAQNFGVNKSNAPPALDFEIWQTLLTASK